MVKGLFQWTIHVAQEKYLIMGGDNHFFFFTYGGDGLRFETIEKLGWTAKRSKCLPKETCQKGILKFCSLKFTFVGSCAMNMNCVSWNRCQ